MVDAGPAGATRLIAEYAATLPAEALPNEVVALTRRSVLDSLGVALAATGLAPEADLIRRYITDLGGRPDATVLGSAFACRPRGRRLRTAASVTCSITRTRPSGRT